MRQAPLLTLLSGLSIHTLDHQRKFKAEVGKINWSHRKRTLIHISMERLWLTIKFDEVNRRAYSDGWKEEIRLAR